ncbi:gluconolactonase, partial [Pseudomonas syringae pv. pisi str. 1704B]
MDFSSPGNTPDHSRRGFLKQSLAVSATVAAIGALPRLSSAQPLTQRYPDPLVSVLDDSFTHIRIFNASV